MARGKLLDERSAARTERAVIAYEQGNRNMRPVKFRTVSDEGDPWILARYAGAWPKGELRTVEVVDEDGEPFDPPEYIEDVKNRFADVDTGDEETYGECGIAFYRGVPFMTEFECGATGGS
jgi:hypothetical protein